jgi:hypothetical protein
MDVVRAFVSIHRFQIHHVADDIILVTHTVACSCGD